MFRSNWHRRIMAVVFVAAMALASARPAAAAAGMSWREAWEWLGSLWSGVTILQPAFEAAGDCGLEIDPDGKPRPCPQQIPIPTGDCGPEIDPDGRCHG